MAGSTLATADAALKDFYLPAVREQLNNDNMFLNQIDKDTENVEGRNAVLSLHVSRNSGVGARAEGGTLPTPGAQGYVTERVPLRYMYGTIQLTGPEMAAMKSDKGSFVRALDSEIKGLEADVKRDQSRQVFGTSNGVIATAGTTTASTTVVLAAATTSTQLRQLAVGDVIDIGTVATPTTIASARTITAITPATPSITISGAAVTTSGSHFIFRSGAGGATTAQKEWTGLTTIVNDSGTLHNVDPTATPVWKSYVNGNSGTPRSPTDNLFEKAVDEIFIESGRNANLIVTSLGVQRAFAAGLKSQKRFNDTVNLKGGFKALTVTTGRNDLAITGDRDCPNGTAFIVNTAHIKQMLNQDWDWMSEDGAVLSRVVGQDAYGATLRKYSEITTDQRNAHGRLDDLTEG